VIVLAAQEEAVSLVTDALQGITKRLADEGARVFRPSLCLADMSGELHVYRVPSYSTMHALERHLTVTAARLPAQWAAFYVQVVVGGESPVCALVEHPMGSVVLRGSLEPPHVVIEDEASVLLGRNLTGCAPGGIVAAALEDAIRRSCVD